MLFGTNCTTIFKNSLCNWESLTRDTMRWRWRKSALEGLSAQVVPARIDLDVHTVSS